MSEISTADMLRHFSFLSNDCPGHDLDELIKCPKCEAIRAALLKRDALKAEVEENKQLIHDLTTDMNDYHDRAEKAEAALAEAKCPFCHPKSYLRRRAYRKGKEGK